MWTPATTEAFATYGVIDDGAMAQPVALPGKVWPQFGGLEVTTASTNLQALTDAMLYLVHYPFECAEQRSSRIMAIAALRDVLSAFKTKDMPTRGADGGLGRSPTSSTCSRCRTTTVASRSGIAAIRASRT